MYTVYGDSIKNMPNGKTLEELWELSEITNRSAITSSLQHCARDRGFGN